LLVPFGLFKINILITGGDKNQNNDNLEYFKQSFSKTDHIFYSLASGIII